MTIYRLSDNSRRDRYLAMTAAMTQVPIPTASSFLSKAKP